LLQWTSGYLNYPRRFASNSACRPGPRRFRSTKPTATPTSICRSTRQKQRFDSIDGERTIGGLARKHGDLDTARALFERLGWYDQVALDVRRRRSLPMGAGSSSPEV
jgi:hypothetical protein